MKGDVIFTIVYNKNGSGAGGFEKAEISMLAEDMYIPDTEDELNKLVTHIMGAVTEDCDLTGIDSVNVSFQKPDGRQHN